MLHFIYIAYHKEKQLKYLEMLIIHGVSAYHQKCI